MDTRKYRAKTTKEALSRISRELGPDAVIVNQRKVKDPDGSIWFEVIAAPRDIEATASEAAPNFWQFILKNKLIIAGGLAALIVFALLIVAAVVFWPRTEAPGKNASDVTAIDGEAQKEARDRAEKPVSFPTPKASIAVLPFADLSPERDQEYFCDGLADELINKLVRLKDLRVPARTSAFFFRGKDVDARQIGEKLNVEHVLEGSVRKSGDRLKITVQLVNTEDGYHLWSNSYDGELKDIFELQEEIAAVVVDELRLKLVGKEESLLKKRCTDNVEAYNLYLKGRFFWDKRNEEGLKKALEYFQEAIEIDPDYALAYAGLAEVYAVSIPSYGRLDPKESYIKAKEFVLKALTLDSELPDAYSILGIIYKRLDRDWAGAEKALLRAIELDTKNAIARQRYGNYLFNVGRFEESRVELQYALELDPLSMTININYGFYLFFVRKYEAAIIQYKKVLELNPKHPDTHALIALCYWKLGKHDDAFAFLKKTFLLLGIAREQVSKSEREYRQGGISVVWRYLADYFVGKSDLGFRAALCYAAAGDKDKTLTWLERAVDNYDPFVQRIKASPMFDFVRADPRFEMLIKKIGLTE